MYDYRSPTHYPLLTNIQMGHWTMDGASSNTMMMQAMEAHLNTRQIDYDAADNHIICIEHNTANTNGRMIVKASTTEYSDNPDDFADPVDSQDGVRDVIALVHNIVHSIRASSQRLDRFNDTIKLGNERRWFGDVKVPELQLLHDVKTWWGSVYAMLKRFHMLRPVCVILIKSLPPLTL
jgi:hypothetical protein